MQEGSSCPQQHHMLRLDPEVLQARQGRWQSKGPHSLLPTLLSSDSYLGELTPRKFSIHVGAKIS